MLRQHPSAPLRMQGSALVLSLVILTAITLGAMVAMQRSTLQLRMVSNMQHNQQVFDATYSYASQAYYLMSQNSAATRSMMATILADEDTTVEIYTANSWSEPSLPSIVGGVDGTLAISNSTAATNTNNPNYLKANSGNSSGSQATYYFSYNATGTDSSGRISSTQEIGLSYSAPSGQ